MKRNRLIVFIFGCFLIITSSYAQSWQDLLKMVGESSTTTNNTVTDNSDLVGSWNYVGSAVDFKTDDLLKKAGGKAVASGVKSKLDEQLGKFGVKSGLANFTFNADNTFLGVLNNRPVRGNYTYNSAAKKVTFTLAGFFTLDAQVSGNKNKKVLLFDADKLLLLLNYFGEQLKNPTIKAMATLAGTYEGMLVGVELKKK